MHSVFCRDLAKDAKCSWHFFSLLGDPGFANGSEGKESFCNSGDPGSFPG